ncbi:MAG TPA: ABC transporter permease [Nocardioidaceae bacterium]|jgi:simple sugar transport system permease protein
MALLEMGQMSPKAFATRWASQIGITVAFALVWLTFIILAPETFLDSRIYVSFGAITPYFALPALLLTMVIVCGDIDLSFPSVMAMGMLGFIAVEQNNGSVFLAVLAALAVGAAAGLFNGLIVTIVGVPALVVTIGTQFLFRGITLVAVSGKSYPLVETRDTPTFNVLVGKLHGVPMQFIWLVAFAVGTWLLLYRHRLGHNAHVIGDNRHAAELMGIPIRRTRVILFVLTGMAAALSGVMNSLQVSNFYPGTLGTGFFLPALAAVFVGGTSVFGGRGTVWGTFIGAFMIGGITAGIVAVGLTQYWTNLIYGAIVLIAISIHAVLQRRFER